MKKRITATLLLFGLVLTMASCLPDSKYELVTNEQGETVTDENGEAVTVEKKDDEDVTKKQGSFNIGEDPETGYGALIPLTPAS